MKKYLILLLLIFILGCSKAKLRTDGVIENINLKTVDNVNIVGTFYKANIETDKGIILLHMLNRDRSDWHRFARMLQNKYNVVSIDLRGHGLSGLKWTNFNEDDFNKMVLDVSVAKEFLVSKNINDIAIIGASIGANVALNFNDAKTLILLSPGEDYKGVKTLEAVRGYNKKLLIVVSKDDEYSFTSSSKLDGLNSLVELKAFDGKKHGTDMFGDDLNNLIYNWLAENL